MVAPRSEDFQVVGSVVLDLPEKVYVGLAVSAHDDAATQTAVFSGVTLK